MTKTQVQIGSVYSAKVSNKIARVRLVAESRHGGWDATNMDTGKPVRIKSAQRLRRCLDAKEQPATKPKAKIVTKAEYEAGTKGIATAADVSPTGDGAGKAAKGTKVGAKRHSGERGATGGQGPAGTTKAMSLMDAAAHILSLGTGDPMRCKDIVDLAIARSLWTPRTGKTPSSTLYAAILREIASKGDASRFVKTERGKFALKDSQYIKEEGAKKDRQS